MAEGSQHHHQQRLILLNPPPTKKWVTFQDWDEELGQPVVAVTGSAQRQAAMARPIVNRRHSCSGEPAATAAAWTVLSSSLSSESSLGSNGEGGQSSTGDSCRTTDKTKSAVASMRVKEDRAVAEYDEVEEYNELQAREPIFNASFGGYKLNGEAATMKTMWEPPPQRLLARTAAARLSSSSSVSSIESELGSATLSYSPPLRTTSPSTAIGTMTVGITCPSPDRQLVTSSSSPLSSTGSPLDQQTHWLRFSAFDEVRAYEKTVAEAGQPGSAEGTRYSALEELREGSRYLGWSNHVLGAGPYAWSEHMKSRPTSLVLADRESSSSNWAILSLETSASSNLTVETLSTPEMTGLRTISWPRSPTRSFVRNFP